jgi:hypothetical protein
MQRTPLIWASLGVLVISGCGSGGTLTKKMLQKQAQSIASLAAEGSLVARETAKGRMTSPFVRVHSQYLQEATKKVEKELGSAKASGSLEAKRSKALTLASTVVDQLGLLRRAPSDRELARRVESGLTKDAADAKALGK